MSLKLDGSNSDLARFVGISQKFNGIDTKNGHIYIYIKGNILGGGNSNIFYVHPDPWGR